MAPVASSTTAATCSISQQLTTGLAVQLLHHAVRQGDAELLRLLLRQRGDPDGTDARGRPALVWAAKSGRLGCLRPLLDGHASPNRPDAHGWTPIFFAASAGHSGAVQLLSSAGARADQLDTSSRTSLFHSANTECTRALLCARCPMEHRDPNGQTALFHAARMGDEGLLAPLLEHRCNPDTTDAFGRSPLFFAALGNGDRCLRLLLEARASADWADSRGWTVSTYALSFGREYVARQLALVPTGCQDLPPQNARLAALLSSVSSEHPDDLEAYLTLESRARPGSAESLQALCKAAEHPKDSELRCRLLVKVCSLSLADMPEDPLTRWTPLYPAAAAGNASCLRYLMEERCDPNHNDTMGQTPLYTAIKGGHTACGQALLDYGCEVDHHNIYGQTPQQVAENVGHAALVALLSGASGSHILPQSKVGIGTAAAEGLREMHPPIGTSAVEGPREMHAPLPGVPVACRADPGLGAPLEASALATDGVRLETSPATSDHLRQGQEPSIELASHALPGTQPESITCPLTGFTPVAKQRAKRGTARRDGTVTHGISCSQTRPELAPDDTFRKAHSTDESEAAWAVEEGAIAPEEHAENVAGSSPCLSSYSDRATSADSTVCTGAGTGAEVVEMPCKAGTPTSTRTGQTSHCSDAPTTPELSPAKPGIVEAAVGTLEPGASILPEAPQSAPCSYAEALTRGCHGTSALPPEWPAPTKAAGYKGSEEAERCSSVGLGARTSIQLTEADGDASAKRRRLGLAVPEPAASSPEVISPSPGPSVISVPAELAGEGECPTLSLPAAGTTAPAGAVKVLDAAAEGPPEAERQMYRIRFTDPHSHRPQVPGSREFAKTLEIIGSVYPRLRLHARGA